MDRDICHAGARQGGGQRVVAVAYAAEPDRYAPVIVALTVPVAPGTQRVEIVPDHDCPVVVVAAGALHVMSVPLWVHPCHEPVEPLRVTPAGTETRRLRPPATSWPDAESWMKGASLGPPIAIPRDSCPWGWGVGVVVDEDKLRGGTTGTGGARTRGTVGDCGEGEVVGGREVADEVGDVGDVVAVVLVDGLGADVNVDGTGATTWV